MTPSSTQKIQFKIGKTKLRFIDDGDGHFVACNAAMPYATDHFEIVKGGKAVALCADAPQLSSIRTAFYKATGHNLPLASNVAHIRRLAREHTALQHFDRLRAANNGAEITAELTKASMTVVLARTVNKKQRSQALDVLTTHSQSAALLKILAMANAGKTRLTVAQQMSIIHTLGKIASDGSDVLTILDRAAKRKDPIAQAAADVLEAIMLRDTKTVVAIPAANHVHTF